MSSINSVTLVGNLTRDVELKFAQSGTAIGSTGIALNRKYGDKEEVTFVDLTFFGKLAEIAGEYATKGKQIAVQGRLKLEQWETDGQKRSKIVVVVNDMQLLGSKDGNGSKAQSTSTNDVPVTVGQEDQIPF